MIEIGTQDFSTHLNYISCLAKLSSGLVLSCNQKLCKKPIPLIIKKGNLIKLTLQSLKDELGIVNNDREYSYASTSWLPIKSYYLIFNLLLTVEYGIKAVDCAFNLGHERIINEFTNKLAEKEIIFNKPIFNQVFDQQIFNFRCKSGENLSKSTDENTMYMLAMKKIAKYKFEEWKRKQKSIRTKEGKENKVNFLKGMRVSIFDFFYFMRIRSNYRDFAFIDGVSTAETEVYFRKYITFTFRFYRALDNLRTDIIFLRNPF